jgi:hypothetical protein
VIKRRRPPTRGRSTRRPSRRSWRASRASGSTDTDARAA